MSEHEILVHEDMERNLANLTIEIDVMAKTPKFDQ